MHPDTIAFNGFFDVTTAIDNFQINRPARLSLGLPAPFILNADLLNVLASSVEDLDLTGRRFRCHRNFEEHVRVRDHVDSVLTACLNNYVLFFCCAHDAAQLVQDCFALF